MVIDGTGSKSCLIMGFVINSDEATDSATRVLVIRKSRCSIPDKTVNSSEYVHLTKTEKRPCFHFHASSGELRHTIHL